MGNEKSLRNEIFSDEIFSEGECIPYHSEEIERFLLEHRSALEKCAIAHLYGCHNPEVCAQDVVSNYANCLYKSSPERFLNSDQTQRIKTGLTATRNICADHWKNCVTCNPLRKDFDNIDGLPIIDTHTNDEEEEEEENMRLVAELLEQLTEVEAHIVMVY